MIQVKPFNDERLDSFCIYCGESPETCDHIPSKIFLDEPFPDNLPVVSCCLKCNQGFSLDEEYVACLIECTLNGTTEIENLKREKIRRILSRKEFLRQRLSKAHIEIDGNKFFKFEEERLNNVILKLARGHAKYELSETKLETPLSYWVKPILTMSEEEFDIFFSSTIANKLPEVGSRAMQKLLTDGNNFYTYWTNVQTDNYMYFVSVDLENICVKLVIWGYLAAEIIWD